MAKRKKLTTQQQRAILRQHTEKPPEQLARELGVDVERVRRFVQEVAAARQRRERLFRWLLPLIPVLLLLTAEGLLRLLHYAEDRPLFVTANFSPDYYTINPSVGRRYFVRKEVTPKTAFDFFRKKKPANGYRIFVLGGSSAAGYPYFYNGTFPRMLARRLQDAFPQRTIEVVNLAMPAVNSFTVLDFMRELVQYAPDAVLIYAGHNEFYGALGVGSSESLGSHRALVNLYLRLQRFEVFCLLRDFLRKTVQWVAPSPTRRSSTLMERMVRQQEIPLGSATYRRAVEIFRDNLRDVLEIAQRRGVRVVLSELVSNLRDQPPFVSMPPRAAVREQWEAAFRRGVQLLQQAQSAARDSSRYRQALQAFTAAARLDSLPAKLHFAMGRCYEGLGQFDRAREAYLRARDLDALRFRAPSDLNAVLQQLGREFHVPVVAMKRIFAERCPHGLIDRTLMLEHLHPNLRGYFVMANAFFDAMKQAGMIENRWPEAQLPPAEAYWKQTGVTQLDHAVARLRIGRLTAGWPFRGRPGDPVRFEFTPKTELEKLAYSFWLNEITWEQAHVRLAEYLFAEKKFLQAAEEYRALILAEPFNNSAYLRRAEALIAAKQYDAAEAVLQRSLKLEDTGFAHKWLGAILLKKGNAEAALPHLRRAHRLLPADLQVRYNLSGALALSGRIDEAIRMLQDLLRMAPNFPGARPFLLQLQARKQ